jgi:hypothetical protein
MSVDPYDWPSAWIVDVYDEPAEVVVTVGDRLYAVPYTFNDRFSVDLGEPREVVAGYIEYETESVHYVLTEAWLSGTSEELLDSDYAWLSKRYMEASEDERESMKTCEHRRLPFAVHGAVHTAGWRGAWKMLQFESYMRPDLNGGNV